MERGYDLNKLIQEAKVRWLKPMEVQFILLNHECIGFTSKPPQKPQSGSVYIFNKRVNRYFRNDGHSWQRKKGGKTLAEGHERLKVDNQEVLTCYYTLGDENPNLRRRIFWMLDPAYEHVVLVHYREYLEEKFNSGRIINLSNGSYSTPIRNPDTFQWTGGLQSRASELTGTGQTSSSSPGSTEEVCSPFFVPTGEDIILSTNGEDLENLEWVENYARLEDLELSPEYQVKEEENSKELLEDLIEDLNVGKFNNNNNNNGDGHSAENGTIEMLKNSGNWWMEELQYGETLGQITCLLPVPKPICTIKEISPEWAFANEATKVIITGEFPTNPTELRVQFGEKQIPLEFIQQGVFKFSVPFRSAQKINLHVIDHTGEPCSESREFIIRENPNPNSDELELLVKLVNYLLGSKIENLENLMVELVKDKLKNWILKERIKDEKGGFVLPKKDHGIVHLIAGLGYDSSLKLLLDSGVNVNYRDPNGWTPLHWAARFGREETVISLILAGASVEAVTDPTSHTEGHTAGATADLYGHKGIAAYLSEAKLTTHPLASDPIQKINQKALNSIHSRKVHMDDATEDQLCLRDCLEGARNAVQAATRIQLAFRNYSFKTKRESAEMYERENSGYLLSRVEMSEIGSRVRVENAALSIQKNFRCWRKRKEFVCLRKHAVKIQTHYRAHQARKYKNLLSSVSILEKVVLRWYKRGVGLRGFQPGPLGIDEEDETDIIKAFRKQKVEKEINNAVSRVLCVVDSPEARQQYRRMLNGYQLAKSEMGKREIE